MMLIAINTVHGNRVLRSKNEETGKEMVKHKPDPIKPGAEFDPADYGVSDDEVTALLKLGAVKRKTRVVADDDKEHHNPPQDRSAPVTENDPDPAPNTAPRGPASGLTQPVAPNTEKVGRNARAS